MVLTSYWSSSYLYELIKCNKSLTNNWFARDMIKTTAYKQISQNNVTRHTSCHLKISEKVCKDCIQMIDNHAVHIGWCKMSCDIGSRGLSELYDSLTFIESILSSVPFFREI